MEVDLGRRRRHGVEKVAGRVVGEVGVRCDPMDPRIDAKTDPLEMKDTGQPSEIQSAADSAGESWRSCR